QPRARGTGDPHHHLGHCQTEEDADHDRLQARELVLADNECAENGGHHTTDESHCLSHGGKGRLTRMPEAAGPLARRDDWTVRAADTVDSVVSVARDKAVVPATTVSRVLVYGLLAAIVGTMTL